MRRIPRSQPNAIVSLAVMALFATGCAAKQTPAKSGEEATAQPPPAEETVAPEPPFKASFTVPEVDGAYYEQSLTKLAGGNVAAISTVDFVRFRFSFIKWFKKGIPDQLEEALGTALANEDHGAQVAVCDQILSYDFTDIQAHILKSMAQEAMGEDDTFHTEMAKALLDSILATGDGRTMETAFHVAQVKEEYALIHVLGLSREAQSLLSAGDHSFDRLECTNDEGHRFEIYFDISEHMAHMMSMFSGQ